MHYAGVSSVALGAEKDRVVVTGEEVDAFKLAKSLRKKFKTADILTVAEVKWISDHPRLPT